MYEEILSFYREKWSLEGVQRYLDTSSSLLFKVLYKDKPSILKIFKNGSDETRSWVALKAYGGFGAVKIYKHTDSAILMQEIRSTNSLVDIIKSGCDEDGTIIFCDIIKKLHRRNGDSTFLLPILDLAQGFNRYADSGNSIVSDYFLKKAQKIFLDLESTQKTKVILHGDLHHFNILHDKKYGWLAIDPKGYIGEPEFEIGAYLKNPVGFPRFFLDKKLITQRIKIVEDRLGYDRDRMLKWAFSLTILSVIWNIEAKKDYQDWLRLSLVLDGFID